MCEKNLYHHLCLVFIIYLGGWDGEDRFDGVSPIRIAVFMPKWKLKLQRNHVTSMPFVMLLLFALLREHPAAAVVVAAAAGSGGGSAAAA